MCLAAPPLFQCRNKPAGPLTPQSELLAAARHKDRRRRQLQATESAKPVESFLYKLKRPAEFYEAAALASAKAAAPKLRPVKEKRSLEFYEAAALASEKAAAPKLAKASPPKFQMRSSKEHFAELALAYQQAAKSGFAEWRAANPWKPTTTHEAVEPSSVASWDSWSENPAPWASPALSSTEYPSTMSFDRTPSPAPKQALATARFLPSECSFASATSAGDGSHWSTEESLSFEDDAPKFMALPPLDPWIVALPGESATAYVRRRSAMPPPGYLSIPALGLGAEDHVSDSVAASSEASSVSYDSDIDRTVTPALPRTPTRDVDEQNVEDATSSSVLLRIETYVARTLREWRPQPLVSNDEEDSSISSLAPSISSTVASFCSRARRFFRTCLGLKPEH